MSDDPTETIRFFLPGPSYVTENVRQAMTRPMQGHRSPPFRALYESLARRLPRVLRTAGDVMIATGSSTLVMESAVVSTAAESVLCLTCGAFSERWHAISRAAGKSADQVAVPWGQPVDPDLVRRALRRKRYDAVTLVHNETSTGVMSPLAEVARAVREESDALLLVDTVSSLGGAPVETDAWGIDVVLAGTQKALALPPGLTLFTLSARAAERAAGVARRGFYTDLLRYRDKHREGGFITTPAIPLIYALDVQLDRILAEGMEARWERHAGLARQTAEWAAGHGCEYASSPAARSLTVSCLHAPAGIAAPELVQAMAGRGFTLGGGYGDWKASTFRIGHMGEVRASDLDGLFAALDEVLNEALAAMPAGAPSTPPASIPV
jgi:aspartate aminotransferase-like enzyme